MAGFIAATGIMFTITRAPSVTVDSRELDAGVDDQFLPLSICENEDDKDDEEEPLGRVCRLACDRYMSFSGGVLFTYGGCGSQIGN